MCMIDRCSYHGVGAAGVLPSASVFIIQASTPPAPNEPVAPARMWLSGRRGKEAGCENSRVVGRSVACLRRPYRTMSRGPSRPDGWLFRKDDGTPLGPVNHTTPGTGRSPGASLFRSMERRITPAPSLSPCRCSPPPPRRGGSSPCRPWSCCRRWAWLRHSP